MKEVKLKNICGKRTRVQYEDYIVLDEALNSIIHLDKDIQQQNLQQANIPTSGKKADEKEK